MGHWFRAQQPLVGPVVLQACQVMAAGEMAEMALLFSVSSLSKQVIRWISGSAAAAVAAAEGVTQAMVPPEAMERTPLPRLVVALVQEAVMAAVAAVMLAAAAVAAVEPRLAPLAGPAVAVAVMVLVDQMVALAPAAGPAAAVAAAVTVLAERVLVVRLTGQLAHTGKEATAACPARFQLPTRRAAASCNSLVFAN